MFAKKMQAAGLPALAIRIFEHYYNRLLEGATGYIDSREAGPVNGLPDYDDLGDRYDQVGREALARTVVLKLNGGLGTTMGMNGPKALLPVKNGLSFLDIILRQVLHLRQETGVRLPLVLMNSFNTHAETQTALAGYPTFHQDLPIDFVQHEHPKIWKESLKPVEWPDAPEKEWCPPGHGDIYVSLITTGMLDKMLEAGYEYLFVSNSDNLGAILDPRILGYFVEQRLPFLMEVAHRTLADSKGGHLSRRPDGQLILRERSQCPPEEIEQFQDIRRYQYFNTNNLWLHLPALQAVLRQHDNLLDLPLIRNEKPVDPTNPSSPRVYQLETAMGSAISLFAGAQALRVPRSRFIPVKKTNDLLLLWSDVYELTEDYRLQLVPDRQRDFQRRPPLIFLDDRYYGLIADLQQRFPHGAPSLRRCVALRVEGNFIFGKGVVMEGTVRLVNDQEEPVHIPDGARLQGEANG
ncbi:MAG TPA: UTP--glucose-1-phosphate uridylyltransferase [Caldilineaceae bacterium]|nr:UTP--glucose-1-phosphate uridylyltransferase [Caldilineaceae bacterium]